MTPVRICTQAFAIAAILQLTACTTTPAYVQTDPPRVDCEQGPTRQVAKAPIATDAEWLTAGKLWALDVLGILDEERELRRLEQGCIRQHRTTGVIR